MAKEIHVLKLEIVWCGLFILKMTMSAERNQILKYIMIFFQCLDLQRSIGSHQKTFLKAQENPHLELHLLTKA